MAETTDERQAILTALLDDPPAVHWVDSSDGKVIGVWSTEPSCYRFIAAVVSRGDRTLETGCGVSTALFAALGARHRCATAGEEEVQRLRQYLSCREIPTDALAFDIGPSHVILPRLDGELDFVLLDGGHGFPIPMLDWFYACRLLRAGGTLVVDDVQLPAVRVLVDYLYSDPRWQLLKRTDKWVAFRRLSEWDLAEGWWDQEFYRIEQPGRVLAQELGRRVLRRVRERARQFSTPSRSQQ